MTPQQSLCASPDQEKVCGCCSHMPRKLDAENLLILSLIQLLCGSAAIILFGVVLTKEGYLHEVGTGMWAGSLMLAAGCLGVATSRHRSACTLVSLLVMCVMSAVTSAVLAAVSTAGLVKDGVFKQPPAKMHLIVLHTLLFIVGFLECSVTVATAIICGRQVCFGAIYLPVAASSRRRNWLSRDRNRCSFFPQDTWNNTSLIGSLFNPAGTASVSMGPSQANGDAIGQSLSSILRGATHLPVLTTNSYYANVLFPQQQQQHQQMLNNTNITENTLASPTITMGNVRSTPTTEATNCRTSLVYLLPSPSSDQPSIIFPPFPPCYSIQEMRPLSAYACVNTADSGETMLQPALLVEEDPPPPYNNSNNSNNSFIPLSDGEGRHPNSNNSNNSSITNDSSSIVKPPPESSCGEDEDDATVVLIQPVSAVVNSDTPHNLASENDADNSRRNSITPSINTSNSSSSFSSR